MSTILKVVEIGHPVLRQTAKKVKNITSPDVQALIDNMLETIQDARGIGLAAPQLGISLQLFIVSPQGEQAYPHDTLEKSIVVINPIITPLTKKKLIDWEGCLSIPGIRGLVPRPSKIEITYTTRLNEKRCEQYDNFSARIFQHEYDHLHGKFFLDRMKNPADIMTDNELERQYQEENDQNQSE